MVGCLNFRKSWHPMFVASRPIFWAIWESDCIIVIGATKCQFFWPHLWLGFTTCLFSSFLSPFVAFKPLRGYPGSWFFMGPHIWIFTKAIFQVFFLLFTVSLRLWKPGPTLVPGVFWYVIRKFADLVFLLLCYVMSHLVWPKSGEWQLLGCWPSKQCWTTVLYILYNWPSLEI